MPKEDLDVIDIRFVYKEPFIVGNVDKIAADKFISRKQVIHEFIVKCIKDFLAEKSQSK